MTADELLATFRRPDYKPPVLPAIAIELHQLIQRPMCDVRQVQQLLERDPLVAGKVLRTAQSPLYATNVPLRSLSDAVNRLGIATINQIVLEVTVGSTLFRARGYDEPMEQLRKHSIACAYIARAVAHAVGEPRELAFMCGLFHDIGLVGCMLVIAPSASGRRPFSEVWPIIDGLHAEVGEMLVRLWNLPREVALAVADHHRGTSSQPIDRLARVVYIADALANANGIGIEAADSEQLPLAYRLTGFDEKLIPQLEDYAATIAPQIT